MILGLISKTMKGRWGTVEEVWSSGVLNQSQVDFLVVRRTSSIFAVICVFLRRQQLVRILHAHVHIF